MKGVFISLEGIEGTGKTTQIKLLAAHLRERGYSVTETAEPGGTWISLRIREILLSLESRGMDPVTELLLYNAARVQHIREVISPALGRGDIVISDRFSDSTAAYQGYGRGIDRKLIDDLDAIATDGLKPDLTILLDVDVETGLRRNRQINKNDRLEQEDISFHEKVRQGFIELAGAAPDRIKKIDSEEGTRKVQEKIYDIVDTFLQQRRQ
jgi:dTMP kinase